MTGISNNQIITLHRGDTFYAPLFINYNTKLLPMRYKLEENDKVYLGILEANQPFECALIKKVYTKENENQYGDIMVYLASDETQFLLPGTYYYEVKLEHHNLDGTLFVDTIIPRRKLFLVE